MTGAGGTTHHLGRSAWLTARRTECRLRAVVSAADRVLGNGTAASLGRPVGVGCLTGAMAASLWGKTPRQSVEAECQSRGHAAVVAGCKDLLAGKKTDPTLVVGLGGRPARWVMDPSERPGPEYWLRVWALRGLLWAWDDAAGRPVRSALQDDAWRVREMACKVLARHRVVDALPDVALLQDDEVPRVRRAATTAVKRLTDAGS